MCHGCHWQVRSTRSQIGAEFRAYVIDCVVCHWTCTRNIWPGCAFLHSVALQVPKFHADIAPYSPDSSVDSDRHMTLCKVKISEFGLPHCIWIQKLLLRYPFTGIRNDIHTLTCFRHSAAVYIHTYVHDGLKGGHFKWLDGWFMADRSAGIWRQNITLVA